MSRSRIRPTRRERRLIRTSSGWRSSRSALGSKDSQRARPVRSRRICRCRRCRLPAEGWAAATTGRQPGSTSSRMLATSRATRSGRTVLGRRCLLVSLPRAGRVPHVNHSERATASVDSTPLLLEPRASRKPCTGSGSRTSSEKARGTGPFPPSEWSTSGRTPLGSSSSKRPRRDRPADLRDEGVPPPRFGHRRGRQPLPRSDRPRHRHRARGFPNVRSLKVPKTASVATSAGTGRAERRRVRPRASSAAPGCLLRIISGAEEARYAYLGVASAWELANDIVCDLGGGSLQLAEVAEGAPQLRQPARSGRCGSPNGSSSTTRRRGARWRRCGSTSGTHSPPCFEAFGGAVPPISVSAGTVRSLARAAIEFREVRSECGPRLPALGPRHRGPRGAPRRDARREARRDPGHRRRPGRRRPRRDRGVLRNCSAPRRRSRIVVSGTGIREGIALEAVGGNCPLLRRGARRAVGARRPRPSRSTSTTAGGRRWRPLGLF